MSEEQRPSGPLISKAIHSARQSGRETDLAQLERTLAKSSLWKANTLQRIEKTRSASRSVSKDDVLQSLKRSLLQLIDQHREALVDEEGSNDQPQPSVETSAPVVDDSDAARRNAKLRNEVVGIRKALAQQVNEAAEAKQKLQEQEATLQERNKEIKRLQKKVAGLQEENLKLSACHKDDLDGERIRIVELQQAYDQFQQQADQLLSELEEENIRLRFGRRRDNDRPGFKPIQLNS